MTLVQNQHKRKREQENYDYKEANRSEIDHCNNRIFFFNLATLQNQHLS